MGTTKKANDDKDRKKADKGDRRRGRSRDRRSGAEAPKRKDGRKQKTRSRSRPRLRSAEAVSAERPTKTSSKEGKDHGRRTVEKGGGDHVSLTSDEESSESERPRVDDEAVDDDDADKEGDAATEPATAKLEPAAAASCPEGPGEGKDQVKEPTGAEAGRGPSKPRSKVSLRSATRPRSPQGPPPQTDASDRDNDNKHGKYNCSVCGRTVGGGEAGSFQHKRSAYHLSSWVWYKTQAEGGKRSWKDCQADGERWANSLWREGKTGPADFADSAKRQARPPPIRSDVERKKRDGPGPGPDKGPGSGSSAGGSATLLVSMWEATLRELKG